MAHPLNRPQFDRAEQRVVRGYGILQPRVTPSLAGRPRGIAVSTRVLQRPAGWIPTRRRSPTSTRTCSAKAPLPARASTTSTPSSGAFRPRAGKRDAQPRSVRGRLRARGLASDVEVVDEFPSRYDVASETPASLDPRRLAAVAVDHVAATGAKAVPAIGRFKMIGQSQAFARGAVTLLASARAGCCRFRLALVATPAGAFHRCAFPTFLPIVFGGAAPLRHPAAQSPASLPRGAEASGAAKTVFDRRSWPITPGAWATRWCGRLRDCIVTHRHLLEWTTAAQSSGTPRLSVPGFYRQMIGGTG